MVSATPRCDLQTGKPLPTAGRRWDSRWASQSGREPSKKCTSSRLRNALVLLSQVAGNTSTRFPILTGRSLSTLNTFFITFFRGTRSYGLFRFSRRLSTSKLVWSSYQARSARSSCDY